MAALRPRRLTPGSVASHLLCLDPDRDERAPQLCAEMLLTLVANGYAAPADPDALVTPKRQQFAVRSLAVAENFLAGREQGRAGTGDMTPAEYGGALAAARPLGGSANLGLAQQALEGLVDPDTQRAQRGAWLLRPFHESLLWYDARRAAAGGAWTVRKVHMRGSGITLARMLLDPSGAESTALGAAAVAQIREALQGPSPLSDIGDQLQAGLPERQPYNQPPATEDDEREAWRRGADDQLRELSERLCRHAEGVMCQGGASGPARLWQLRTVLALDLALHVARTAWARTGTPGPEQFLLLSFGGGARASDPVRQRSEEFYQRSRIRISEAIVSTLAGRMRELHREGAAWAAEFEARTSLGSDEEGSIASQLRALPGGAPAEEFERVARNATEASVYDRGAGDGYRVLLESVGMLTGTGSYRYLTAGPDLLAALVGALSARMPMSSREFFAALNEEWGLVVNQEAAAATALSTLLDGAALEGNARRAEKLMSDAGLALGLSDRTTVVGERARRAS